MLQKVDKILEQGEKGHHDKWEHLNRIRSADNTVHFAKIPEDLEALLRELIMKSMAWAIRIGKAELSPVKLDPQPSPCIKIGYDPNLC